MSFENDIFDDFMSNRACDAANFSDFVSILNMKAAVYSDNEQKMEVITELLNDIKLFTSPAKNNFSH